MIKDPKKARTIFRKKTSLLQKNDDQLFCKTFYTDISKNRKQKVFSSTHTIPAEKRKHFWKVLPIGQRKSYAGGQSYCGKRTVDNRVHNVSQNGGQYRR